MSTGCSTRLPLLSMSRSEDACLATYKRSWRKKSRTSACGPRRMWRSHSGASTESGSRRPQISCFSKTCSVRQLPVRLIISTLFWLAASPSARASSVYDPILRFRTISTEHFVVYFHQREEPLAARLAVIAEDTWRAMGRPLGTSPPARTHVVLVDQTELSNGFATPIPYNM